jgi:hypothetical protein
MPQVVSAARRAQLRLAEQLAALGGDGAAARAALSSGVRERLAAVTAALSAAGAGEAGQAGSLAAALEGYAAAVEALGGAMEAVTSGAEGLAVTRGQSGACCGAAGCPLSCSASQCGRGPLHASAQQRRTGACPHAARKI